MKNIYTYDCLIVTILLPMLIYNILSTYTMWYIALYMITGSESCINCECQKIKMCNTSVQNIMTLNQEVLPLRRQHIC